MKIYTSNQSDLDVSAIGGKGLNLFRLKSYGLPVPDFAVIDQSELSKRLSDELKSSADFKAIRTLIDQMVIDEEVFASLNELFPDGGSKQFAVRSSAVQEDGKNYSFAGQFETHLYVDYPDIPRFIKEIWKSVFTDRVATYLETNGLEPQFGIGVVIQEMIDPDVSGVAFGINPNTGEENSRVVCSVYGVGEGLVSGALNADTYTVSGDNIEETLVVKDQAARRSSSGNISLEPVEAELQNKSSLSAAQVKSICEVLENLNDKLVGPQDIEFAIRSNELYLLQTRPITSVKVSAEFRTEGKNRIIWDNSNIIESYPGVTTPLTFSYILHAYKSVYILLATLMGASKRTIRENDAVFGNMLGFINGRVYYNLFSWYRVLALFPGYRINARFMENMMGVKERFDLPAGRKTSKIAAYYRTFIMVNKIIYNLLKIKSMTRSFYALVQSKIDEFKALDLSAMSAFELKDKWQEIDSAVTPHWNAPMVNDTFAMVYFGRLQKMIEKYQISDNQNLQNDLLCGSKDIISVEPIHRSIALSTRIQETAVTNELFTQNDPGAIWEKVADVDAELKTELDRYIHDFGDRCIGELKLETISYKQDPTLFIANLKSFVEQKVTSKSTASTIDQELRSTAEAEVRKALKNKPFKKMKFNKVLRKTRYFVSNRENLRYERTRTFGLSREMFTEIGRRFEEGDALESHRDIFFLTKEEIFQYIDGAATTKNIKAIVEVRKKEFDEFQAMDDPSERFTTYESVNYGNDFYDTSIVQAIDGDLSGLGCCPGVVKATVRLVKDPKEIDSLNGDILVTSSTDPGWVTLFPTASAIIVERGSLLSHSAIVSREMGIPCIVGVTGLLKTLKTGDIVEMNGSTGQIKIIEDE